MKITIKNIFWYLSIILLSIFWPISFIKTNRNWIFYVLPALIIIIDYFLSIRQSKFRNWLFLLMPILQPVLALIPLFLAIEIILTSKHAKLGIIYIILALILVFLNWNQFKLNSVININKDDIQTIERQRLPYENKFMGQLFQNKVMLMSKKYFANFFLIMDPNNYFFALHPREISVDNQNLTKFPFLAIIFFIIGIYILFDKKSVHNNWIIKMAVMIILSLSFLKNIDKYDIILFWPILLICLSGINRFRFSKYFLLISGLFIFISFFELARILLV